MDWNLLKIIDAIAVTGSLTKAAKLLNVDTSTLSRQLQKFEQDYRIKVFKRSGNVMAVTVPGQSWVTCAQNMKTQIDALWHAHNAKVPATTITSLEIFLNHYLLPRVAAFSGPLECIGSNRNLDLARREANVAIRFGKPTKGDFMVQKLFDAGHAIFVRKDFRKDMLPDFKKCPWVSLNEDFDHIADRTWFRLNVGDEFIKYKVSSCEQLLALLKNTPVLGILPCYLGDAESDLVRFVPDQIIFERTAWLVMHRDTTTQPHIRKFLQELKILLKSDMKLLQGSGKRLATN